MDAICSMLGSVSVDKEYTNWTRIVEARSKIMRAQYDGALFRLLAIIDKTLDEYIAENTLSDAEEQSPLPWMLADAHVAKKNGSDDMYREIMVEIVHHLYEIGSRL